MVNELWPFLNNEIPIYLMTDDPPSSPGIKNNDNNNNNDSNDFDGKNVMHIWVDSLPSSEQESDFMIHNPTFKNRKNSDNHECDVDILEEQNMKHKKKSKREYKKHTPNKKVHPRSHEKTPDKDGSAQHTEKHIYNENQTILLCKSHFFNGSCRFGSVIYNNNDTSQSKSSKKAYTTYRQCPFFHYNKKSEHKTLYDILLSAEDKKPSRTDVFSKNDSRKVLQHASDAAASALVQSTRTDMDSNERIVASDSLSMLYYLKINFEAKLKNNMDTNAKISDILSETLSSLGCPVGSIVYMVFNTTLIFDRYNKGIVVDKELFQQIITYEKENKRPLIDSNNEIETANEHHLTHLPVTVVEYILTFLPDEASGVFSMICKQWNTEIGKTSPSLWQYLMTRKKWISQSYHDDPNEESIQDNIAAITMKAKELFISHKNICQIFDTLVEGLEQLQSGNVAMKSRKAVAMQQFKNSKDSMISGITMVQFWDDCSMITMSRKDCILSIFKAKPSGLSFRTFNCKQLVNTRVAPFPHSKKHRCELQSFDLDEKIILCCYYVNDLCNWLTLTKRDDLLANSAEAVLDDNILKKYDLSELIIAYCTKSPNDGKITRILTFFRHNNHFDMGDMKASIISDVKSCKEGNFVFIADILLSDDIGGHDILARVVTQFSAQTESLTFCQCVPDNVSPEASYLSSYNSSSRCMVYTFGSPQTLYKLCTEKRQGITNVVCTEPKYDIISKYLLENGLGVPGPKIFSIVTHSEVISTYTVIDGHNKAKALLTFFNQESDEYVDATIVIDGVKDILSFYMYGDYVVLLCEPDGFDNDQAYWHWFGDAITDCNLIIVVHAPSRSEIYRRNCDNEKCDLSDVTLQFLDDKLILAGKGNDGVLMIGPSLKQVEVASQGDKEKVITKLKAKKKQKVFKKNKKDGYVSH